MSDLNNEIIIGPFRDHGFDRLVVLSQETYPGHEISEAKYLGWEYVKNPDGVAVISIAEIKNHIIAQYIVLPRQYFINSKPVKGSLSVNTLTHADHRNKNLFSNLSKETFKICAGRDINFTLGFPNQFSTPAIKKKSIFEIIGHLPVLVRPISGSRILLSLLKGKKDKRGNEIDITIDESHLPENISLFNFSEDAELYEEFISQFTDEKNNITDRNLNFLKWRYDVVPFRKYYLIKSMEGNRMTGFAVFRAKYIYGFRCGILVDFCHISGKFKNTLLPRAAAVIAKQNKLDLVLSTAPAHSTEFKILRHTGFFSLPQQLLPQKLPVIIKKHSESCPDSVRDFKRWFLTFGDYDIF